MVVDLLRLEHRIERHHAAAELPGRQQSDEELQHILEVQRHAVAPRQPSLDKGSGQGIRGAVHLSEGEGILKVVKERGIGVRASARPEHLDAVRERRLQVRLDPFWIERQPRSLLVDTAHRCTSYAPEWALLKALVDPVVVGRYPHAPQTQKTGARHKRTTQVSSASRCRLRPQLCLLLQPTDVILRGRMSWLSASGLRCPRRPASEAGQGAEPTELAARRSTRLMRRADGHPERGRSLRGTVA